MGKFLLGFVLGAVVATVGLTSLIHTADYWLTTGLHTISKVAR